MRVDPRPQPRVSALASSSLTCVGAGYIEYADKMSILPALALNGQLLNGHPVLVKPSESEKNAAAQLAKVQAAMSAAPNPLDSQLRISNVHKNVRESDLQDIFSPFGEIEQIEIQEDAAGGDLGMAAVQFTDVDASRKAMQALNGLELAGATIVVTCAAPNGGAGAGAVVGTGAVQQSVDTGEIDDDGKTGLTLNARDRVRPAAALCCCRRHLTISPCVYSLPRRDALLPIARGVDSVHYAAFIRQASLMQKLQRPGAVETGANAAPLGNNANGYGPGVNVHQTMPGGLPMQNAAAAAAAAVAAGGAMAMAGGGGGGGVAPAAAAAAAVKQERTILLRNMFAPEDAKADEDFEEEMKEDIGGECAKYGRIEHVKVDKVRCCPRRTHSSRQASILYTVL